MTVRGEFPDFDALDEFDALLGLGFTDTSWHNDLAPSMSRPGLSVFVDYRDPNLSEYGPDRGDLRFLVFPTDAEGAPTDDEGTSFATLDEVVAHISTPTGATA